MSATIDSTQRTVSDCDESLHSDALASDKKRMIQHLKANSAAGDDSNALNQMRRNISRLWAGYRSIAYCKVRDAILDEWRKSESVDREFLERAVVLLNSFQHQPMESMKDCLDWSKRVKKNGIDSDRYFSWVKEQYEQLAREQREGFADITLERFSESLMEADWKNANDESVIVNSFLWNADISRKPDIYLGTFARCPLSVRVNGRCLKPPKANVSTAESYSVSAINPNILLSIRYVPGASAGGKESFLFIPIGNVFRMGDSSQSLDTAAFQEVDWKVTGDVLVLRISDDGVPSGLYMIMDHEFRNIEAGEGNKPMKSTPGLEQWALKEITNMDHHDLTPYKEKTENRILQLRGLATSKVEIVQTGMKGNWHDGDTPVGLYPIKQDLEGG